MSDDRTATSGLSDDRTATSGLSDKDDRTDTSGLSDKDDMTDTSVLSDNQSNKSSRLDNERSIVKSKITVDEIKILKASAMNISSSGEIMVNVDWIKASHIGLVYTGTGDMQFRFGQLEAEIGVICGREDNHSGRLKILGSHLSCDNMGICARSSQDNERLDLEIIIHKMEILSPEVIHKGYGITLIGPMLNCEMNIFKCMTTSSAIVMSSLEGDYHFSGFYKSIGKEPTISILARNGQLDNSKLKIQGILEPKYGIFAIDSRDLPVVINNIGMLTLGWECSVNISLLNHKLQCLQKH